MKSKTICMKKILCLMFVAVFAVMCAVPLKANAASAYEENNYYPTPEMGVTQIKYRVSSNGQVTFNWYDDNLPRGTKVDVVVCDGNGLIAKRSTALYSYGYRMKNKDYYLTGDMVYMQIQGSPYITWGFIPDFQHWGDTHGEWRTCKMVIEKGTEGMNLLESDWIWRPITH